MMTYRETILAHASNTPYNAQERHERYELEKRLKGRTKGSSSDGDFHDDGGTAPAPKAPPKTNTPAGSGPITPKRVAELQARLSLLKELLTRLTEEANKKAGVDTSSKKDAPKKAADTKKEKEKPKTAAEKKDAAKKEKEARAKDPKSSDTVNSLRTQLNQVHDQIADMRAKIAAMNKATPKPPTKPTYKSGDDKKPSVQSSTAGKENRQNGSKR